MKKITLAIGSDHRGFKGKEYLIKNFSAALNQEIVWHDCGADSAVRSDYPVFAQRVVQAFVDGVAHYGILLCGTGIGMAIAANRYPGMYAGVAWNAEVARRAKEEDGVNILVLPADFMDYDEMVAACKAWLEATFKGGRYQERLAMIDQTSC